MDPVLDCPICFETYGATPQCVQHKLPCCDQSICRHCSDCLRRCPFCRVLWHGEEEACNLEPEEQDQAAHRWQRRSFPNPILAFWGTTLAFDVLRGAAAAGFTGARAVATAAAAAAAEASPAVIAGSVAGTVALAGGVALAVASQHSARQAEHLQAVIVSQRGQHCLRPRLSWRQVAGTLWEALQWHLSPQKEGMPHVYHGSPWRSRKQETHLTQVRGLLEERELAGEARQLLWGNLVFCYVLWLEYTPHTANWGSSPSYGLPPLHLCWHNRWREDLRHAASDLARHLLSAQEGMEEKESACAACLLAMLDHVLSWSVTTLDRGQSDLIHAEWCSYPSFCKNLEERFAFALAAAMAPAEAEVHLEGFDSHLVAMAIREVPDGFRGIW